jgi:hypothetical protein
VQLDRAGEAEPEWLLDRDVEEAGLLELLGAPQRTDARDDSDAGTAGTWLCSAMFRCISLEGHAAPIVWSPPG